MAKNRYVVVPIDSEAVVASVVKKKTLPANPWILVDVSGEGNIFDADKQAIMQRVQIHARDLRILDPLLSYPSTILARERAIVLNLEHIKAIVTSDEVLLRDPLDEKVIPVVEELRRRLPQGSLISRDEEYEEEFAETPFEFRALEVALEAICSFLDARTTELVTVVYPTLDELTSQITGANLDKVRKLKTAITRLTTRVQKVRDELEELLEDDNNMAGLYLTRKVASAGGSSPVSGSNRNSASSTIDLKISRATIVTPPRGYENDVEELEMILETYFIQIEDTLNKLTTLREYIDDTEDYLNFQLDNHRNRLIRLDLFLSSAVFCLSIFSLVTSFFGMSVPYKWNHGYGYLFKWVLIITATACSCLYILIIYYAHRKGLVGS